MAPHIRPLRAALLSSVLLATVVGSGVALAAPNPNSGRLPANNSSFDQTYCGFPLHAAVVTDKEYYRETILPNGNVIDKYSGTLVLSFTNTGNGKTVVLDLSGPFTATTYYDGSQPDGSTLYDQRGTSYFDVNPAAQAATGEPGLIITTGHAVVLYGPTSGDLKTFSLSGQQIDGCALIR